jgi:hypothetical protein
MDHWRLALSKRPNRVSPSPQLRTETDPLSEMLFFLFRIPYDGQSPEPQKFWVSYAIVRTLYMIAVFFSVQNIVTMDSVQNPLILNSY